MLAAPIDATNSGGGIALWDTRTGNLVHRLGGLYDNPDCLAFSPDGGRLAATNSDAMMAVWDIATGKLVGGESIGHIHPATTLRFLNDDRQLASAGDDGTIRIWNLADSRPVRSIQIDGGGRTAPVGFVVWMFRRTESTSRRPRSMTPFASGTPQPAAKCIDCQGTDNLGG